MAGLYVDTSSLGRLLLQEPDADAIRKAMANYTSLWSSQLLSVEMRRLGRRVDLEQDAERLLGAVELTHLGQPQLNRAGRLEPVEVRTLDAIHLEAALWLRGAATIAAVLTHDKQLRRGCQHHGLPLAM
jgi:predicted nucleic acid-binding protein